MSTLYFKGSEFGTNGDWSTTSNWYLSVNSSGIFSSPAGRIPNASDTAVIYGLVGDISGSYTNPSVIQIGSLTNYIYGGNFSGDSFNSPTGINFIILLLNIYNGQFWASGEGQDGTNNTFNITTMNVYGYAGFEGSATIGTSNFYNFSTNGASDASAAIYGNANFYNYSANANSGGGGGVINGNATFHDYSTNAQADNGGSNNGTIYGNAVFNDNSANCKTDNPDGQESGGLVYGNATFNNNASNGQIDTTGGGLTLANGRVYSAITYTSTSSFAETLQAGANATTITMPATGISQSKALLNRLLKLPFPVVIQ